MTQETDSKMDIDEETPTKEEGEETKKNENVTPSASGESAAKYPDMKLAQSIHKVNMLNSGKLSSTAESTTELMTQVLDQVVKEMENPSLYSHLVSTLNFSSATVTVSESSLESMKEKNATSMKELEEKV